MQSALHPGSKVKSPITLQAKQPCYLIKKLQTQQKRGHNTIVTVTFCVSVHVNVYSTLWCIYGW